MYDYGARFYMPDIGRWGVIDPRSQYTHETYSYVWNNPIFFNDPTGMEGEDPKKIYDPKGGQPIEEVVVTGSKPMKSNMAGLSFTHQAFIPAIPAAAALLETAYYALVGYAVWDIADKTTDAIKNSDLSSEEANEETGSVTPDAFPETEDDMDVNGVVVPDDSGIDTPDDMSIPDPFNKKNGRKGKQQRLSELGDDPKVSSSDRGWIKNEKRHIRNGNRKTIRNPRNSRNSKKRGTELAHPRGQRAKDGHSYKDAKLQDADLHKLEHKYGGYR